MIVRQMGEMIGKQAADNFGDESCRPPRTAASVGAGFHGFHPWLFSSGPSGTSAQAIPFPCARPPRVLPRIAKTKRMKGEVNICLCLCNLDSFMAKIRLKWNGFILFSGFSGRIFAAAMSF